ncbi:MULTISPECIES: GlxA family transcriptional regulator [Pacificibacter]|uniref:GlxA family transcriptional regulator n=1 Tax=Pacificibacter TaxID=1042323 RepID=UPI002091874C|nr:MULTISPECIES: GlxA family transcriptional regulator [Pacificibacter]MDO6616997.1 GlxA family transcriptional regulator [Pacificibacter sp. 1_MG-2023]
MQRIGFFLIEGYAMMSTAAAMEPLRAANLFSPEPLYEITLISTKGGTVTSTLPGLMTTQSLAQTGLEFDIVFVVAGGDPMQVRDAALLTWLRRLDHAGVALGGISGGSAILAKAGLMENRRFTIHWHHLEALKALSDHYRLERRLYVIDRDRYTCAGGAAPLDMMHAMISAAHGVKFARRISDWFIQTEIRVADAPQQASIAARYGPIPRAVAEALDLMESHIADPLNLAQLADLSELSPRQLQRQFTEALGLSVMHAYRNIRLDMAHDLLKTTRIPISDITEMTGFSTQSTFSVAYKMRFQTPPGSTRSEVTLQ